MGKERKSFFFGLALLAALAAPALTAQQKPQVRDLGGALGGHRGERARITIWHDDGARVSMKMLAEGFSKKDGTFEFPAVPWLERYDWGRQKVILVARSKTKVGLTELRRADVDTADLHIPMHRKVDIHGTLADARTGKPIAGAWIWPSIFQRTDASRFPAAWVTEPLLPWRAETDAQGRFVLREMPEGLSIKALAGGPGHARTWVDLGTATEHHKFSLQPGGEITGRVVLPDGKPAARVQVETTSRGDGRGHTLTDDQGRFTLKSLGAGTYKVWAEVPDLTVIAATELAVRSGETTEAGVVRLVRGGFIVGRVLDADTGKPIVPGPHTDVAMYGPARGNGGSCQCTPVLDDGTFRIRAPAGRNRIYLRSANGYNEPSEYVQVVEGEEVTVEWKLHRR